jgi:hypothetical protein
MTARVDQKPVTALFIRFGMMTMLPASSKRTLVGYFKRYFSFICRIHLDISKFVWIIVLWYKAPHLWLDFGIRFIGGGT